MLPTSTVQKILDASSQRNAEHSLHAVPVDHFESRLPETCSSWEALINFAEKVGSGWAYLSGHNNSRAHFIGPVHVTL